MFDAFMYILVLYLSYSKKFHEISSEICSSYRHTELSKFSCMQIYTGNNNSTKQLTRNLIIKKWIKSKQECIVTTRKKYFWKIELL